LHAEDVPFILVELSSSLNVKKLKPGDPITAQVVQDVLSHGKIIVPAGSKLVGHITEANVRSENIESRLGLVFDKVLLKHREEVSLRGVVQAVAGPVNKVLATEDEDRMLPPPRSMSGRPMAGIPDPSVRSPLPGSSGDRSPNGGPTSSAQNQTLSLGTRPGVFGLKDLSLSTQTGGLTPGPVIVSKAADVKLEYGTQILLKTLNAPNRPPSP